MLLRSMLLNLTTLALNNPELLSQDVEVVTASGETLGIVDVNMSELPEDAEETESRNVVVVVL